ncbi:GGDEF domain-containing protein [Pseudoalteromonas sp. SCSIO 43101]|nr:GGDEF domain-containing protein [Pseudoalteromonas sp. SCSIO 43101]URQ90392.1 GGDEF domain-containing protein [Pseudoalteromonas sp. SCSIO 43101]
MFWRDKRALKRIAETDTLTGAKTRRAMYKLAEKALQVNNSTCFVLVDLDHFKQINDSYGHLAGDEVLKGFSNVVSERIRETDLFCRYGGEEFLLILNNLDKKTAVTLVDGIREKFEGINSWKELDSTTNVSFSAGVVEINQVSNIDCIIKQCDGLLYKAKANGRAKTES